MEPDGHPANAGAGIAERPSTVNKRHPYRELEREYITSQISLRELCRRHNISAHSLVTVITLLSLWRHTNQSGRR